ncbi:MAG: hypothetical protein ABSG04_06135 [Verrucomicrobiota bacterium]
MKSKSFLRLGLALSSILAGGCHTARPHIIENVKPAQLSPTPEFDSIGMMDRKNGWALNARAVIRSIDWVFGDKAILKTADGGRSWKSVLSAGRNDMMAPFFYDSRRAWVVTVFDYEQITNTVAIFRTSDGGRSWNRAELRQSQPIMDASLAFTDAHTGWLMLIPAHGMNSSPGYLYRTDDGGANWRKVNSTEGNPYEGDPPTQAELESRHPHLLPYLLSRRLTISR